MTLTLGMPNSSANDLFEVAAALSLASGAFIGWAGESTWLKALLVFVLAVQINLLTDWSRQDYIPALTNRMADAREVQQLAEYARTADGPILADEYMALITLEGRPVAYQPFEMKQVAQAGLWDERPFVEELRQRRFALILRDIQAKSVRWTPAQLAAMEANYQEVGRAAGSAILEPRP